MKHNASTPERRLTGVILAGGRARRMGGLDKGLVELAGRPMVSHIVDALRPQVHAMIINANRNAETYAALGECRVVPDESGDFAGPLAGMASAMAASEHPLLLTVPCDSPLVAGDLAARMLGALSSGQAGSAFDLAVAHDGERLQPVFALLSARLREDLLAFLAADGRKIDTWYARHRMTAVDFSDRADMFTNINTPAERERMEVSMQHQPG
ncbi:MAG: molybdenum cofactor guanylyltransferase MobA [Gammaproteobacteria bacterium]